MNGVIAMITMRQLLSRRRTLFLGLLGVVLLVVTIAYRVSGDASSDAAAVRWTMTVLEALGLTSLVPLVALIMGTSAIGSELEDGTAVHLLTKPVARWRIGAVKLLVAICAAAAISLPPTFVAAMIAAGDVGVAVAYTVASFVASSVYVAIFMALSLVTSRAFIIGLGYVLIWEGLLAGLFPGIRTLSVRQEAISFARSLSDRLSAAVGDVELPVAVGAAAIAAAIIAALAVFVTMRRLARLEIASETS
jgi:ABC-2 type transport system permease protein